MKKSGKPVQSVRRRHEVHRLDRVRGAKMKTSASTVIGVLTLVGSLMGCASSSAVEMPEVPDTLRPPPNQVLFLEARATGVQIYECAATRDDPPHFQWVFKAPEAELFDRSGRKIGSHYAGPTWESTDGSTVVGEVKARASGPDASAIPWLLLSAKSVTGQGTFAQTKSIQRVQTAGGSSPSEPCGPAQAQHVVRVPYRATYYFYTSKP
jgi:hypothetical protein